MNRLSKERSIYLKNSAYQKIDWYTWSDEPFERARLEDKPVFLSSGAAWCHWCHVMAKECFENEEIVRLLNENFINVKIDRDERPEIDRRYQLAVQSMGITGGWPLSVFLTPDKKVFYGGTYFPPEDSYGRPGFIKVLSSIADFYKKNRDKVIQYSEMIMNSLKPIQAYPEKIDKSILDTAIKDIFSNFDPQNGGFGRYPKFPMHGVIEFLINRFHLTKKEELGYVIKTTLDAMAKGGFYDQIGGGFHRYSTDEAWIIPHFEKMAVDNAWLLRNYIDAYQVLGYEYYKEVSLGILNFLKDNLSDPEGGFYSSMDADVIVDDEGGYFTWTDEEFKEVLDKDEYEVMSLHLFHEAGAMHHNRSKRVLFIAMDKEDIANKLGKDIKTVIELIETGKEKLYKKRNQREKPIIDKAFYTSINGMLITSYLKAYRVLRDKEVKLFALSSLNRIIERHFIKEELFHTENIKALLEDYVYLIEALISAYETTGESSYLKQADLFMKTCIDKFWDNKDGGFYDSDEEVLGIRIKGIEDIPQPSANSLAIILLLKLYNLTDNEHYLHYAEDALRIFSSSASSAGIYAGYFFSALDCYFNLLRLTLHTEPKSNLAITALSTFSPYTSIRYADNKGYILPCRKKECYEPIYNVEELKVFLEKLRIT